MNVSVNVRLHHLTGWWPSRVIPASCCLWLAPASSQTTFICSCRCCIRNVQMFTEVVRSSNETDWNAGLFYIKHLLAASLFWVCLNIHADSKETQKAIYIIYRLHVRNSAISSTWIIFRFSLSPRLTDFRSPIFTSPLVKISYSHSHYLTWSISKILQAPRHDLIALIQVTFWILLYSLIAGPEIMA